jgi:hypothetical protein
VCVFFAVVRGRVAVRQKGGLFAVLARGPCAVYIIYVQGLERIGPASRLLIINTA